MTRDELNRRISTLRGDWAAGSESRLEYTPGEEGASGSYYRAYQRPKDWHADANWPTLLREARLSVTHIDTYVVAYFETPQGKEVSVYELSTGGNKTPQEALAAAVCAAWLKWKEQS